MSDMQQRTHEPETPAPQKKQPNWGKVIAIALIAILVVLTIANLDALLRPIDTLNSILAPITIGLVLAYILNPFLRFFECKLFDKVKKRTVNRAISMLFTYLLFFALLAGMLFLIIPSLVDSIKDLQANGMMYINRVIDSINDVISHMPFAPENGADLVNFEKLLTYLINLVSNASDAIMTGVVSIAGSVLTVLKNILIGIFISIYVLLSKDRLNAGCRRVFRALLSEKSENLLLHYFSTAHKKFGGFFIGKIVDSLLVGLLCGVLFSIFNIPYAVLIAVIIGVTDIIPFFGPFIGAIPSAIIIFIASPMKAIVFVLLILVVQQIDGNLIAPIILGDRTGLTSLGVIIAITVMGGVFGLLGMLIGVPLFALIMAILDDFIQYRLKKKGHPTNLKEYYPATAFIRPHDTVESDETLTQKFAHWVSSVEDSDAAEKSNAFSRSLRRGLLAIGRFFHRTFTIKPIPEDRTGGIFMHIAKNGMSTNRSFFRAVLLSIVTLGIYPLYLVEVMAQSMNAAARKDGKRTWGVLPFVIFTVFTLGVFAIVWHYKMITRIRGYCERHGKESCITHKFYLCWTLPGALCVVGPLIALARFLRAFNEFCYIYNENHTFPLSEDEIKRESAPIPSKKDRKNRVPLFSADIESLIIEAEAAEAEERGEAAADEGTASPSDDTVSE